MRSKLLNKKISAISLISAMDEKEKYYISVAYHCPIADEFEELRGKFSYKNFKNVANNNKKLKKKVLKSKNKDIIEDIFTEVRDTDFCGLDFVIPCEMEEGNMISGIKYGIYSVVLDNRIPELVEDYLENEEYENRLTAVDSYMEDSGFDIPLAILTVIIYMVKNKEFFEEIQEELELKLLDYYSQWIYEELNERLEITIKELYDSYIEKENLLNEIKDHKEKNKALREENNRLVKVRSQFNDILKEINKSIKATAEMYPEVLKETVRFKKDVSESNFNSIITNLTLQVSDLKIVNKELRDKNKELEARVGEMIEKNKGLSWELERINENKKESKYEDINYLIDEDKDMELKTSETSEDISSKRVTEVKSTSVNEKGGKGKTAVIGYCEIIDGVHYVVLTDGTRCEIKNILTTPYEKTYLASGQFIKIDINGNILHIYKGYTDKTLLDLDLVEVRYFNRDYYFAIDDEEVQINLRKDIYLTDNMIFAVDKDRNIRALFKYVRFELDFFVESINAKGHKIYYVLKKLVKGVMIREIISGEEIFIPGSYQDISEGVLMVFDRNENLINIIPNARFYTNSNYYREGKEAEIVQYQGELYFKLKNSLELIPMGETSKAIAIGDTVILDEFYNIIKYPEDINKNKEIKENKKILPEEIESEGDIITITHKVLIVGDLAYSNNYKLNFLKKGYEVEVVDGFDSFNKISLKLKDVEYVIVISNHISHGNMWRLKESHLKVIYPGSDGANRVLEEFEEYIKNRAKD